MREEVGVLSLSVLAGRIDQERLDRFFLALQSSELLEEARPVSHQFECVAEGADGIRKLRLACGAAPKPRPVRLRKRAEGQCDHTDGKFEGSDVKVGAGPIELEWGVIAFIRQLDERQPAALPLSRDDWKKGIR